MKTVCIYHSINLDGWMSAAIVKHWFLTKHNNLGHEPVKNLDGEFDFNDPSPVLHLKGYNYGQPIPDLSEYDTVIMCDISFPAEVMFNLFEQLNENFIYLDHHISAINDSIDNGYKACNGIRTTKLSTCELTWQYFFPNETIPEIVRLLGRYDCFGHKFTKEDDERRDTLLGYKLTNTRFMSQEEQDELSRLSLKKNEEQKVLEFQYGARGCISNYEEAYSYLIESINRFKIKSTKGSIEWEIEQQGRAIYQYLCTEAKQVYKNGFDLILSETTTREGGAITSGRIRKFICINKERFNPINFGIDYHKDGYNGVACFWFDKGQWAFSLYNDNGHVDCSAIAKQFGGGGHKGAAGFRIKNINEIIK